jgi:hypothetical protein
MRRALLSRRLLAPKSGPTSSRRGRARSRPLLEALEERVLLTALDPNAFTSLGTLDLTVSGSYTLDTSTQVLSGPGSTLYTGVTTMEGSEQIAVFDFSSVSIAAGATIIASGSDPLAILSQGSIQINGTINAGGQSAQSNTVTSVSGGPGGGAGGEWTHVGSTYRQEPGGGPGGGHVATGLSALYGGSGGGGFGGAGGGAGYGGASGGGTYGNLFTQLQGGSGGASGSTNPSSSTGAASGGGGGGALELGAHTTITIASGAVVAANGGNGAASPYGGPGGGSGGGIFLHAPTVTNDGTVSVQGGSAGTASQGGGGGGGGGGSVAVLYGSAHNGTGTYTDTGGTGAYYEGRNGAQGVVTYQQTPIVTVSLSGNEVLLSGTPGVTSLGVVYDPGSETYTLTVNSGATFVTDSSLPGTVILTPTGNTATLAPGNGHTWAGLGYDVGTDMTSTTGTTITLGGTGAPASNFGTQFDVANSSGGTTALTINDTDDTNAGTVDIAGSGLTFEGSQAITYASASLTGLMFEGSNTGGATVDVGSVPAVTDPLTLAMGSGGTNAINVGRTSDPAFNLGDFTMTSAGSGNALIYDDSNDPSNETMTMTASSLSFQFGPNFNYATANLDSLELDAPSSGSNTVTVTGMPTGVTPTLAMGPGGNSQLTLGGTASAGEAASQLGSATITGVTDLTINDSSDTSGRTIAMAATTVSFTGGPTITYTDGNLASLELEASNNGSNAVTVTGAPAGVTSTLGMGSGSGNSLVLGDSTTPASGLGNVTITGTTGLTIDDSDDPTGQTIGVTATQFSLNGSTLDYSGAHLTSPLFNAGTGGDTVDVTGSPAAISGTAPISLNMGNATGNVVRLGGPSVAASTLGGVTVTGVTGLTIDDSDDMSSRTPMLEYNSITDLSELTGVSASTVAFSSTVTQVSLLASSNPSIEMSLTVDFSQGNPLPAGAATAFNFDAALGASDSLILQGELNGSTPFDSESYSPTAGQPGAGAITLTAASATSTLNFGGLTPITDTVPATNYTFTAPSSAGVVNITTGPVVDTYQTDTISSGDDPSAFELVNFANKSDVLVDLSAIADPTYILPPATSATGLVDLAIKYFGDSSTGHTLYVNGTAPGVVNTVQVGGNGNTVDVQSVTADGPLVVDNSPGVLGGQNTVSLGDNGSLAGLAAGVTIAGPTRSTPLIVDGSAATTPFDMLLALNPGQTMDVMNGVLPGGLLSYNPTTLTGFTLNTGGGADSLAIDFVNGNPFLGSSVSVPAPTPYTLTFDGGGGGDSLTFQDTSGSTTPIFAAEDYTATGPHSGTVGFYDGTSTYQGGVDFSDLTPTTDSTPVTNYTFTPPASIGTFSLTDDSMPGYALISDPSASPTFESVAYSNKTNVMIAATGATSNNLFTLNNPTAAAGEASVSVDLGGANDTVNIAHNPGPNVALTIDGGVGSQTVTVNAAGLAAGTGSSNFSIVGGAGPNTLRLNDQGVGGPIGLQAGTPTSAAVAFFGSSTSMSFTNMGVIQGFETNDSPTLAIPSPLATIPAQAGVPLVNVAIANFTDADLIETAGSYQATINWGDGTAPTAGTIAAGPTPGQYIISGSHTYLSTGAPTIGVSLTDLGGTFNSTLANAGGAVVPVSTQLDAIGSVGGSPARAMVTAAVQPDPPAPSPAFTWARLSPQSDSGISSSDGITNVTTPTFVGGATPGAVIQVFEAPTGSSAAPVMIATGVASSSGAWSATVLGAPMADGSYQVTATANSGGAVATTSLGTVVIDTVAPVITDVVFKRMGGEMEVFFQDNLSGVSLADLSNGGNFKISGTAVNGQTPVPRVIVPTSVSVTPAATSTGVDEAIIVFNRGKSLPAGTYTFRVIAAGITDVAGNHLNGRFYGTYPSGNLTVGGNFVAQITALANRVLGAFPIQAGFAKPKAVASVRTQARAEAVARIHPFHVPQAHAGVHRPDQGAVSQVDRALESLVGPRPGRQGR